MIPILFPDAQRIALRDSNGAYLRDSNGAQLFAMNYAAQDFTTHGIGPLTDCIKCQVKEELNGQDVLELRYPVTGIRFAELGLRKIILAQPNMSDKPQPFRITSISTPINGAVTVRAEHLVYDLAGVPVLPFTAQSAGAACTGLTANATVQTPFAIGTQIGTIADFTVDVPSSVFSWFGGKEGSLIDIYGGEWHYDGYTATLAASRGQDRGVVIRYGKNLIDFKQEKNCAELWTGVLPYWVDEDGNVVQANIINIEGGYNFRRILALDLSLDFEEQPTATQLTERAKSYIRANKIGVPKVNITLDWVQTSALSDRVDLGDTVTVEFELIGVRTKAKCISTTWDVLNERYTEIEIGDARASITSTIADLQAEEQKQKTTVSAPMLRAIANATALITGNEGGYVVMRDSDGDGYPDELLIMDSPEAETAVRVWRWNQAGLGYSTSGINGPYGLAMTADGAIVADFITAGTMSADRINGGTITGVKYNNGSGTFSVDEDGNVTANSLSSSNATITGGSIRLETASTRIIQIISPNAPAYHNIGGATEWAGNTDGTTSETTWYRAYTRGNISISGTLSQGSDRRKKDILGEDIPDLSKVKAVRFKWNDGRDDLEHVGYIAQDVEEMAPDMVSEVGEYKALDYIQVLVAKVERLERENNELKECLNRLEAHFLDDGR